MYIGYTMYIPKKKCNTMYIPNVYKHATQCILEVYHNVYRYHVTQSTPQMYIQMQHNVYKLLPNVYTPFLTPQTMYMGWYTLCCILYTLCIYIVVHSDVYTLGNMSLYIHCVTKKCNTMYMACNPMYIHLFPNVYTQCIFTYTLGNMCIYIG